MARRDKDQRRYLVEHFVLAMPSATAVLSRSAELFSALLMILVFCMVAESATPYRLLPQDKVRITVYEWRVSSDELVEWKPTNGDYVIQPHGDVTIPIIGDVRAAGATTAELAQSVGVAIKERAGLAQMPEVSVEIISYRPIYVTGQVERPGELPYRSNFLVLQAVALSGGLRRSTPDIRIERDIIYSRWDLIRHAASRYALLARQARFEAEVGDRPTVEFPPELTSKAEDGVIARLLYRERALFEARKAATLNQIRILNDLRAFLLVEIESVEAQLVAHTRQIELVKKEMDIMNPLVIKGLAVEPRRLGLERNVAQLEGDRLRLESTITRARQDISRTDASILDLSAKRLIEAEAGLSETQEKIEEVTGLLRASRALLKEAEAIVPAPVDEMRNGTSLQPIITILRQTADGTRSDITATEMTILQPGDTIRVDAQPGVK